jgi:HPt (histidine-containing phosphotransfer) domain-containing protein
MYEEIPVADFVGALRKMGDDREIFTEVIKTYFTSTPQLIDDVENALESGDRETLRRCAHSLKSSSRAVGALQLGDLGQHLEKSAFELSEREGASVLEKFREGYTQFCREAANEGFGGSASR